MKNVQKRSPRTKVRTEKLTSLTAYDLFFWTVICAILLNIMTSPIFGNQSYIEKLRDLEIQVWTTEPDKLSDIESQVTRIIQEEPNSSFGHYLLAHLYLRQFKNEPSEMDKFRRASELGQQAIELNENLEYGYLVSAEVLDIMGYAENAAKMLDPNINKKIDENWRTLFMRAQLQVGNKPTEQLLGMIRQAMDQEPKARILMIPYVIAMIRSEYDDEGVIRQLTAWNKKFPHPIFMQSLAIAYSDNDHYEEAANLYQEIVKKDPNHLDAVINKGILSYLHLNQADKAEEIFQSALAHPALVNQEEKSLIKSHLARIYLQKRDLAKARNLFREAIAHSYVPLEWLNFSQQVYRKEKNFEQFSMLLEDLQKDLPGKSLLYAMRGEILSENLANHQQAIESYSNAILLEPEKIQYYNGLGLAYYRMQDMNRALSIFSRAAKIDPRDATSRYNEACVLSLLGRTHEAIGSLREAISLDPRLLQTARQDQDFKNIRGIKQFEDLIGNSTAPSLTQIP